MQRREHHGNPQAHAGGPLTEGTQRHIRRAGMRPFGAEVVLDEPDTLETHLLGILYLLKHLPVVLRLALSGPRFGNLNLIEHSDAHHGRPSSLETSGPPTWIMPAARGPMISGLPSYLTRWGSSRHRMAALPEATVYECQAALPK
jgi:hypothetical protein